ncbi:MAG: nucleotidyl transferase AbiEii/AbiGii toxin family protein [Candidatus Magasanikbacteria bacterium]|nr:nucleotidyl transferase AbiEii/AbiGii toxin family protein [Candidatus Magasanikbacteria bacterium]
MDERLKILLSKLLDESASASKIFKRNLLKEFMQILVLDFIYSHRDYSRLVFYGGSCLAHCYGLPRLSEDLDFVDLKKNIELKKMAEEIKFYFKEKFDLDLKFSVQKFRIYLKFPLLKELNLAEIGESDQLFLKVEVFSSFDFCRGYKVEMVPVFKFTRSFLVRVFDLPTLMATKIRAVMLRRWTKTNKKGDVLAVVKGRDYFDLLWYLDKGVKPNLDCLGGGSTEDLKNEMIKIVERVDGKSIKFDLEPLIADTNFVNGLSKNFKEILRKKITEMA